MRIFYPSLFVLGAILSACALSEETCQTGDWTAIGKADGARGLDAAQLERYQKRCAKFDAMPDAKAWEAGRQDGLKLYCTLPNAYDLGKQGRRLRPACAPETQANMQTAYRDGRTLYDIELDINRARADLREAHQVLATAPADSSAAAKARSDIFFHRSEIQRLTWRYDRKEAAFDRNYAL
ncbi:MAG: DUF2799 domain-containing protein [Pseudomonadota bacterium]